MYKYYIYGLSDPRTNDIKYIGKGCGNRMFDHVRKTKLNKLESNNFIKFAALKEILKEYDDVVYTKLFETNDEVEAYEMEEQLIIKYATLIPNGWNMVLGNRPPTQKCGPSRKGIPHSEEVKKRISETMKGKIKTPEHLKHISEALKGNQICLGHRHSEETLKKLSESKMGNTVWKDRKHSEETKLKMSEVQKGHKPTMLGKHHSEETRLKMSNSAKGRVISTETRQKISKTLRDKNK